MIVAAGASHRQPQPDGRSRLYAIDHIFDGVLFGNDSAFPIAAMVAIETAGDLLLESSVWQHVSGDLLNRELIEGHVLVEGINDPIAPPPHASLGIRLIAVGIGISRRIQPAARHLLGVARGLEQTIDYLFVSIGRAVSEKGIHFGRGRREATQIECQPADLGGKVRFG